MGENSTADLIDLRKSLGLTQAQMAERMGVAPRTYQDLEGERAAVRDIHMRAAERAALDIAIERGNPMLAPASVRRAALRLAQMILGLDPIDLTPSPPLGTKPAPRPE